MLWQLGNDAFVARSTQGTSGSSTKLEPTFSLPGHPCFEPCTADESFGQHYIHCIAARSLCELSPCATLLNSIMQLVVERPFDRLIVEPGSADSGQFSKTQWLDG